MHDQSKLKPELVEAARQGATKRDNALTHGISPDTLYRWLGADEQFAADYEAASAESRRKSVDLIADSDDWRAHAWLLERKDPTHWGKQETSRESLQQKIDAYLQGVTDGQRQGVSGPDARATT